MMKRIGLLLFGALGMMVAHNAMAQTWLYSHGPGGTPPGMYGGASGMGPSYDSSGANTYTYNPDAYTMPQVPDIQGPGPGPYGTTPWSGPSGYPCTMPGCR
jgi:hypothetical protein